jgi:hypothetical protein
LLILGSVVSLPTERAVGEENPGDVTKVRNPQTLAATLPCERIALGRKGDYKPCIARLPSGELLVVAFHGHKLDGGKYREDMLLFRRPNTRL